MARILVLEPSLLDRKRITALLVAAGHEVVEVASAAEVDSRLQSTPRPHYHLLVTDLDLPGGAALEWIRRLKATPHGEDLPVLVVSTQVPRERVVETILAGAEHMVTKPFAGDVLLRRVTEVLEEQRLLRQGQNGALTWTVADYLRRELKRARRTGQPLTLLMGVVSGSTRDLAAMVKTLARSLRETDLVYRVGDDRFVVLLPDTDEAGATPVVERIRRLMPTVGAGEDGVAVAAVSARVSTGVAVFPADATDADGLVVVAEERARGRGPGAPLR